MPFDIVLDLLLADGSGTRTEVATRPQMLTPIAFLQMRKLILQFARGSTLEILSNFGWRHLWRTRHQQVYVVNADMSLQDADVSAHTDLTDNFTHPLRYFSAQYLVAVLRHPHKVILDVIRCVRSFSILWHSSPLSRKLY